MKKKNGKIERKGSKESVKKRRACKITTKATQQKEVILFELMDPQRITSNKIKKKKEKKKTEERRNRGRWGGRLLLLLFASQWAETRSDSPLLCVR